MKNLSSEDYAAIFYKSPVAKIIIDTDAPAYTILDANEAYLKATHNKIEALRGKPVFDIFPSNPSNEFSRNIEQTRFSFQESIRTKKTHAIYNYRYDIPVPGTHNFEEHYWTTVNTPVLNGAGEVDFLIHFVTDVTETVRLEEKEKSINESLKTQRRQLYSVFMQSPVGIGIFKGPEYIVELVNPPLCSLYGKTADEMVGKPVFEVLQHARGQGFEALLDKVRLTGEPFYGKELAIPLLRYGTLETVFVNFVYEAFREDDGTISGVIVVATDVTEQVVARQKLEEAEERARLAVDAVGLGTFDLDLLTGEMITSARFDHIFGFTNHVRRSEFVSVIHPDDHAIRLEAHRKALEMGSIFYEVRVLWKDASTHWIRVEGKVYYDKQQKPLRLLGTLLDITEQRKDKQEQQKLITLVDNCEDLMSILNDDGTNSYLNAAGRELLGFEIDEDVTQTPISQLHAPQDFELVEKEILPSVIVKGRWAGNMLVRHRKTGEIFPVYNNCIRIDDPASGKLIAVGAVMRDLRPELAAKKALAESEQLLRSITTAAPTALWMSDENGAITYVNQTWINWTGRSFEENMGAGWAEAVVPEDRQRTAEKFITDLQERNLYEVEFRLQHSDGSVHWCVATGQPQYRVDGSFSGYIGACMDITEQKQLQKQKDNFIGIASHELKTPVTSIKAYTQVLEKMLYSKGAVKEAGMITKMDSQINRLTSLIGDLLDVTKLNSGKLQFNDRDFDFDNLLKEVVEDLQHTTTKHTLIEHFQHTGMVFADRERVSQVISNLISNAIKYSPQSDKIIVRSSVKGDHVSVCIEDFGIGISKDKLDKVFEQFYRVSGAMQHTFPGLGLGLYISSEIIKREGGRIWVTSVEGKGSTFCFELPAKRGENPQQG